MNCCSYILLLVNLVGVAVGVSDKLTTSSPIHVINNTLTASGECGGLFLKSTGGHSAVQFDIQNNNSNNSPLLATITASLIPPNGSYVVEIFAADYVNALSPIGRHSAVGEQSSKCSAIDVEWGPFATAASTKGVLVLISSHTTSSEVTDFFVKDFDIRIQESHVTPPPPQMPTAVIIVIIVIVLTALLLSAIRHHGREIHKTDPDMSQLM